MLHRDLDKKIVEYLPMASLVADYSSDSNTSTSENDEYDKFFSVKKEVNLSTESKKEKLPIPSFLKDGTETNVNSCGHIPGSVFSNPYQEAENNQKSILEKHVKMTNVNKAACINGKKVCWNYLKGRCHFGQRCRFAHGTDIPINVASTCKADVDSSLPPHESTQEDCLHEEDDENLRKRKKRAGLPPGLVPSKKAMKSYFRTNSNIQK